ncbi:pentapeptide repeat-containing protein [Stenomitos frigidus]|uniref:pentapeptide repeat-containing protein n=1 Tax=Stenomitos frigidus TaxID=1886765 RepID=UPI001FE86716|nr:pentapeptide repeat-containing protein [Stenomitos frigidus]
MRLVRLALTAETPSAALDVVKVVISGLGLIATVFAGIGLVVNYQQGQERLITDRFAKAVEQLGSQDIDVRLGGIYSLERIAKDSPKDHWTVMEVLTAYVRNKSSLPKAWEDTPPKKRKPLPAVTTDVQSALKVIERRKVKNDPEYRYPNLSHSNLSHADLDVYNLHGFNLNGTSLSGANLLFANLYDANLYGADLNGAKGITSEQIRQALNWQDAHYDSAFRKELRLPPGKP